MKIRILKTGKFINHGFTLGKVYESIGEYGDDVSLKFEGDNDLVWWVNVEGRVGRGYIEIVEEVEDEPNQPPELKVGMRVSTGGDLFIVMPEVLIRNDGGYITRSDVSEHTIECIYDKPLNPSSTLDPYSTGGLLWECVKKVTMEDVYNRFGCKVEITDS
tara:strand:- start:2619 stop:3098 length:480 start_codon:yes stop_codon:yes gene_type:complete